MTDLQKYNELTKTKKQIDERIDALTSDDKVKEYIALTKEQDELEKEIKHTYISYKRHSYSACRHILVIDKVERDYREGRAYYYKGCLKCGLTETVSEKDYDHLNGDEKIMYNYLNGYQILGTIDTKVPCDVDLARAIYARIKEVHPKINDKIAIKYFEIALDNMIKIPVTDERKESRVKRLSLEKGFNRWQV